MRYLVSILLVAACGHPANDDINSTEQQCTLEDDANVCSSPPHALTASADEATAPAIHAGVTYAIAGSSHRSYVAFTPTTSGTHTLYFGDAAPARVCDETALCASILTSCGDLHRASQYALDEGEHYVIEIKASSQPFRIHIVAPEAPPPPPTGARLAAPVLYSTTSKFATELSVGDLTGDGALDVVVSDGTDSEQNLNIMRNDGSGRFAFAVEVAGLAAPRQTVISDFDSDGDADIAGVGSDLHGALSSFLLSNDGNLQFTKTTWRPAVEQRASLSAGDFNEDGVLDLLTVYTPEGLEQRAGFRIVQMPSLEVLQEQDDGMDAWDAIAGDFNGDGHQDVLAATADSQRVRLWLGDGTGQVTFDREILLAVTDPVVKLVAVNLDGDNYTDFVAFGGGEQEDASVTLSSATGFNTQRLLAAKAAAAGDFDHDGRVDLITGVPNAAADPDLLFWRNTTNGFVFGGTVTGGISSANMVAADVNNDGLMDLVSLQSDGTPNVAMFAVFLGTP